MTVSTDEPMTAEVAPRRKPRRRRVLIAIAVILVPLVIVYGGVCRFLTHKLQATVAAKLDAELKIDSLLYFPPYGVRLSGAHLIRKQNVILDLGRLNLKLAQSPFRKGPIVIEHFDVEHPRVRIIRTSEGLQGGPGFVKEQVKKEPEPRKKFSDFLRLRKFKITNGQITYDDDTNPYTRDVTWRDINVEIHTAQKGPALYTYELSFGNAPIVDASAAGSVDVDALVVALDHLHVSAAVDPAQAESPLPSAVQKIVEDYRVAGRLTFDGNAMVPFRELQQMTYDGAVELAGAKLRVPKWDAALDDASIKLRLSAAQVNGTTTTQPSVPALSVAIDSIHLAAGGATLAMSGGTVIADPASGTWSLRQLAGKLEAAPNAAAQAGAIRDAIERLKVAGAIDFTGAATGSLKRDGRALVGSIRYEALLYPRGLAFQPTKFPAPLHDIGGGVIRVANGEAVAEDLCAMYGQDCWMLNTARIPLSDLKDNIRIEDADGSMAFHPPSPEYPKALRATVKALAPEGEFPVRGWIHVNPKGEVGKRATYDLVVTSDGGGNTFNVTPHRIPITNIRGDARVLRETIEVGTVDIRHFDGDSLGGTVSAKTTFITTKPRSWAGTGSVRDVKLEQLANYFNESDKQKQKLVGRAFANVDLSGETEKATALDSLRGSGRVEVFDGEFFELPVLGPITKVVSGDQRRDLGTVGEAAVLFDVHGRTIHLRDAAVSAPLLGVQGDGEITLDGNLDLNVCAAPLADWRDKLKQTNIPIVSDVTGEVVGAIQRLLNSATRGLLYEFRVAGNVKDPEIKVVPAPALNEARAVIFGRMLGGGKSKDKPLIDSLHRGEAAKSK